MKNYREVLIKQRREIDKACAEERGHEYLDVNDSLARRGLTCEQLLILREKLYDYKDYYTITRNEQEALFMSGESDNNGERLDAKVCTFDEVIRLIDNLLRGEYDAKY